MGNIWNFTKYVAVPDECSAIIWYHYGTDPYHSHTRCYGEYMELYEILRNPIVKDNRAHWLRYPCYYMGSIWELTSHIKAIQHPHISHRLSHTISIFGPCMSHINSFGKGHYITQLESQTLLAIKMRMMIIMSENSVFKLQQKAREIVLQPLKLPLYVYVL